MACEGRKPLRPLDNPGSAGGQVPQHISIRLCNNNPVNFVDPDGRSTWVMAKPDGTYTIEGGDLYDNDLNMVICRNVKQDHLVMRNIGDGKEVKITDI